MSEQDRERVLAWLNEERITTKAPQTLSDAIEWAIVAFQSPDRPVTIAQPKARERIEIRAGMKVTDEHKRAFQALEPRARFALVVALRRDAMLLGVNYQGLGLAFNAIGYATTLYPESLTRQTLLEGFTKVQNAIILGRSVIQLHLGLPPNTRSPQRDEPGGPDLSGPIGDFLGGLDLGSL